MAHMVTQNDGLRRMDGSHFGKQSSNLCVALSVFGNPSASTKHLESALPAIYSQLR
jgi:hypothetical protein